MMASSLAQRWHRPTHRHLTRIYFSTQPAHESESFLTGTSSLYAEQMLELWQEDPNSVEDSWKRYFDNLQEGLPYKETDYNKPTTVAGTTLPGFASKAVSKITKNKIHNGNEGTSITRVCVVESIPHHSSFLSFSFYRTPLPPTHSEFHT